jgi:hypothetical protein
VAVHEQSVPVVTVSALVLPIDDTDTLVGATVGVHWASTLHMPTTKISAISTQQCRSVMEYPLNLPGTCLVTGSSDGVHIPRLDASDAVRVTYRLSSPGLTAGSVSAETRMFGWGKASLITARRLQTLPTTKKYKEFWRERLRGVPVL